MRMTLDALPVGASAVVTALRSTGAQRRRMLDLGFVPGSCVRALHVSPWSDPVAYGVRGAVIALRREDAGGVQIEMLRFFRRDRPMPNEAHIIALAGNPNVGKSTVFNTLTGLRQHTGNWPGKTVAAARGDLTYGGERFTLVDLPGTYSLFPNSAEEEIARDYLCSGEAEAVLILADATCLERSLNLVLQTLEAADVPAVVCVNLLDEAAKKGIVLDLPALSHALGAPVVGTAASCGEGLDKLRAALAAAVREKPRQRETAVEYPRAVERAVRVLEPALAPFAREQSRFYALRLLEDDALFFARFGADLPALAAERIGEVCVRARAELGELTGDALRDALVGALSAHATALVRLCERRDETAAQRRDRRLDRLLTSRATGIPVMLALFGAILWLTVEGANVPSQLLSRALFSAQEPLRELLAFLPPFWRGALVDGMYRTLAWVVSVMLPPMAIFFPLFTLLEDVGYLPRVAFVLDRCFARAGAHGRQSLTMCMGLGCNACGVTGCRIIDSPRERLIAMLTNSLVPCNGRFPLLITLLTAFLSGEAMLGASAGLLASLVLSVCVTLLVSRLLSATLLRGESSAFSLELPPYRRPRVGQVLVRSLLDRTVFVLGRAVTVAAPAGLLIYLLGNCTVGGTTLLAHGAAALDPLGRALGLDGMILLAFLLGFPANEIVLPILLMGYSSAGTLVDGASLAELKTMLQANGWTGTTALCMLLFSLFHFPCGTTTLTLARESKSLKWTLVGVALPTAVGMTVCFAVHLAATWLKI